MRIGGCGQSGSKTLNGIATGLLFLGILLATMMLQACAGQPVDFKARGQVEMGFGYDKR